MAKIDQGPPQNLPLDDRSDSIRIPIIVLIVFSSVFVILRLAVSFRNRNLTLLTDHFLWTGHVSVHDVKPIERPELTCSR
jgi:hypothetical protein